MKKKLIVVLAVLSVLAASGFFAYRNLAAIASFLLSKNFGFPISLQELQVKKDGLIIKDLEVFNLKPSKYDPALQCRSIAIDTSFSKIRQKRLTVDKILLDNINLNIQFYSADKSQSNFNEIIEARTPRPHHKKQRPYIIKKLVLKNLDIKLVFHDGQKKNLHIKKLEFNNITEESGFPAEELEKAIIHAIIKSVFDRFKIKNILRSVAPQNLIPKTVPKLIPFF